MPERFPTQNRHEQQEARRMPREAYIRMGHGALDQIGVFPAIRPQEQTAQRPITNVDPAAINHFRQRARRKQQEVAAADTQAMRLPQARSRAEQRMAEIPGPQATNNELIRDANGKVIGIGNARLKNPDFFSRPPR